jgi:hypothetical protein
MSVVRDAALRVEAYLRSADYRGYDPYDALTSPLFRLPVMKSSKIIRWGSQQVVKRLPVNIRPLLGIRGRLNPVTLGLCIQAYTALAAAMPERKDALVQEIRRCIGMLKDLQSKGFSGACWGYDFDWEARYACFPAYTPTVVATGFITNALFQAHERLGINEAGDLCVSAAQFVLKDLRRTEADGTFCFSYSPIDSNVVLNATMKGARLLSQVFTLTGDQSLVDTAERTVRFVVHHQQHNGAWAYALGDTRSWADNFHTGYVLDCLDEFIQRTGHVEFRPALEAGFRYYKAHFFVDNAVPKYYDYQMYPIDSTAAAQSILTLTRFGATDTANGVAGWMIRNMQHRRGYFYYQKSRRYTVRIPYARWSNAWMFLALSTLLERSQCTGST